MKVFISYDRSDQEWAQQLASSLSAAGHVVWYDRNILPGDNWGLELGKALEESNAMIVLLSPDGVKSPYVQREIEYALSSKKYEGRLIPVVVRPTTDIPWVLRRLDLVRAGKKPNEVTRLVIEHLRRTPINR